MKTAIVRIVRKEDNASIMQDQIVINIEGNDGFKDDTLLFEFRDSTPEEVKAWNVEHGVELLYCGFKLTWENIARGNSNRSISEIREAAYHLSYPMFLFDNKIYDTDKRISTGFTIDDITK